MDIFHPFSSTSPKYVLLLEYFKIYQSNEVHMCILLISTETRNAYHKNNNLLQLQRSVQMVGFVILRKFLHYQAERGKERIIEREGEMQRGEWEKEIWRKREKKGEGVKVIVCT